MSEPIGPPLEDAFNLPEELPDDPRECFRLLAENFRIFIERLSARVQRFEQRINDLYERLEELERDPDV